MIDVGTGSGILSIAAAMLEAESVHAYDLDPVAVESARLNLKLNKVSDIAQVKQNNLLDGIEGEHDVIVANILAEVILRFTSQAYSLLKEGGHFITSGIIGHKTRSKRSTGTSWLYHCRNPFNGRLGQHYCEKITVSRCHSVCNDILSSSRSSK